MASLGEALDGDEIWVVRGGEVWWSRSFEVIEICRRGDLKVELWVQGSRDVAMDFGNLVDRSMDVLRLF